MDSVDCPAPGGSGLTTAQGDTGASGNRDQVHVGVASHAAAAFGQGGIQVGDEVLKLLVVEAGDTGERRLQVQLLGDKVAAVYYAGGTGLVV
ncbi:hypothetical protein ACIQVK_21370 [Streptomyces sp. NPDC090493]|uniref:hypothetical protein n=1 Tax=Streptomyces sp. NPDC090493 TaxID=3365964 RepID=UPI003806E25A